MPKITNVKAIRTRVNGTWVIVKVETDQPGLYFLGLPWLSRRASSFIWGVWQDAKYLADHIVA